MGPASKTLMTLGQFEGGVPAFCPHALGSAKSSSSLWSGRLALWPRRVGVGWKPGLGSSPSTQNWLLGAQDPGDAASSVGRDVCWVIAPAMSLWPALPGLPDKDRGHNRAGEGEGCLKGLSSAKAESWHCFEEGPGPVLGQVRGFPPARCSMSGWADGQEAAGPPPHPISAGEAPGPEEQPRPNFLPA